jgi:hypothetical protein
LISVISGARPCDIALHNQSDESAQGFPAYIRYRKVVADAGTSEWNRIQAKRRGEPIGNLQKEDISWQTVKSLNV